MILNAPSFFNSVFALVKPMLNEATKKKIDLLPVANVGEEMLKVIPAEHLPLHYGGTGEVRGRVVSYLRLLVISDGPYRCSRCCILVMSLSS